MTAGGLVVPAHAVGQVGLFVQASTPAAGGPHTHFDAESAKADVIVSEGLRSQGDINAVSIGAQPYTNNNVTYDATVDAAKWTFSGVTELQLDDRLDLEFVGGEVSKGTGDSSLWIQFEAMWGAGFDKYDLNLAPAASGHKIFRLANANAVEERVFDLFGLYSKIADTDSACAIGGWRVYDTTLPANIVNDPIRDSTNATAVYDVFSGSDLLLNYVGSHDYTMATNHIGNGGAGFLIDQNVWNLFTIHIDLTNETIQCWQADENTGPYSTMSALGGNSAGLSLPRVTANDLGGTKLRNLWDASTDRADTTNDLVGYTRNVIVRKNAPIAYAGVRPIAS